jgi:hypothetical protein
MRCAGFHFLLVASGRAVHAFARVVSKGQRIENLNLKRAMTGDTVRIFIPSCALGFLLATSVAFSTTKSEFWVIENC